MRQLITAILVAAFFVTGCRSVDLYFEALDNSDASDMYTLFDSYYKANGRWPSRQTWDSLLSKDSELKKISNLEYKSNHDTLWMEVELEYEDYHNLFKSIKLQPVLISLDTGYLVMPNIVDLKLQADIQLETSQGDKLYGVNTVWIRTKLTSAEKAKLRKWKRDQKKYFRSK